MLRWRIGYDVLVDNTDWEVSLVDSSDNHPEDVVLRHRAQPQPPWRRKDSEWLGTEIETAVADESEPCAERAKAEIGRLRPADPKPSDAGATVAAFDAARFRKVRANRRRPDEHGLALARRKLLGWRSGIAVV